VPRAVTSRHERSPIEPPRPGETGVPPCRSAPFQTDGEGSIPFGRSSFLQAKPLMIFAYVQRGRSNVRDLVRETASDAFDTAAAPNRLPGRSSWSVRCWQPEYSEAKMDLPRWKLTVVVPVHPNAAALVTGRHGHGPAHGADRAGFPSHRYPPDPSSAREACGRLPRGDAQVRFPRPLRRGGSRTPALPDEPAGIRMSSTTPPRVRGPSNQVSDPDPRIGKQRCVA